MARYKMTINTDKYVCGKCSKKTGNRELAMIICLRLTESRELFIA